jgi:predicted membrane metal-binding protein
MTAFVWAGRVGERDTPGLQSLALACATTLLLDPGAVGDAGFQLSYAAVLAILAAGAPAAELATAPTIAQRLTPPGAVGFAQRWRWRAKMRARPVMACRKRWSGRHLPTSGENTLGR